jgi:hypothetical protein
VLDADTDRNAPVPAVDAGLPSGVRRRSAADPDGTHEAYGRGGTMNPEELDAYETDLELALYREYRDVVQTFRYVVETERRFYLCNQVEVDTRDGKDLFFEVRMTDAWVWDMYRPARFLKEVKVLTFRDVNIEELVHDDAALDEFLKS